MTITQAEAHRWLQTARNDRWYREQCPVTAGSCRPLAAVLGVSRETTYRIVRGVHNVGAGDTVWRAGFAAKMLPRVEELIEAVDEGRLVFWRREHSVGQRGTPPVKCGAVWVEPPGTLSLPQRSLIDRRVWSYWRACSTCGERKWLPLTMRGGPREQDQAWVACYRCHPPAAWPAFGAKARAEFLAASVITEYGCADAIDPATPAPEHARQVCGVR